MPDPFIEEQLDAERFARYGCTFTERFAVEIVRTAGGRSYRRLVHPYPMRQWDFSSLLIHSDPAASTALDVILGLYWRLYGGYGGFRLRAWDEDSTNGRTGVPSPTDQPMALVSGLVYQLQKFYGSGAALAEGRPRRTIFKPVAGTVRVAIAGQEITNSGATRWTVDAATGKVTFAADKTRSITAISNATQAVLDVGSGHGFIVGDVPQVSGVTGMNQINLLRAAVVAVGASTITLAINSNAFSAYSSGGVVHTAPQAGEAVSAGCRFDFPVNFVSELQPRHAFPTHSELQQITLEEKIAL